MRLPFLDRTEELGRLRRALAAATPNLAVLYGRRRCGKSRLIQESASAHDKGVYYLADLRGERLQRRTLAERMDGLIPGFARAEYPDWRALLETFSDRAPDGTVLYLDEFPNLARISPDLPSVLQAVLDTLGDRRRHFVICGSSQRMMHGAVLDATAPLYGRASEVLKVQALPAGWVPDALGLSGPEAVEAYAVWGGVPRYWELHNEAGSTERAIREAVLDPNGILHEEPERLLSDNALGEVQPHSILSLIGAGCHRISEIGARLGSPAGNLSRPLAQLVELGYARRDLPFGESPRSTKRTRYRLADPFLAFWYRFVLPSESLLEIGLVDPVYSRIRSSLSQHVAAIWEDLARLSVPRLGASGVEWGPASAWWGRAADVEFDVAAESLDGRHVLLGEAKWSDRVDPARVAYDLQAKAERCPFLAGRRPHYAIWSKRKGGPVQGCAVFAPDDVLRVLR
ncbi:MAG: ATP-binding protein [Kiritimatiellae bacterium]|nr:ATP-binding protein [Kiritimatiellia bacterium]